MDAQAQKHRFIFTAVAQYQDDSYSEQTISVETDDAVAAEQFDRDGYHAGAIYLAVTHGSDTAQAATTTSGRRYFDGDGKPLDVPEDHGDSLQVMRLYYR